MSVDIFGASGKKSNSTNISADSRFVTLTKNLNTKLDKGGDTMKGDLNMNHFKIYNLQDPVEEQSAVNKKYVDKLISQVVGSNAATGNPVPNNSEEAAKIYIDIRETDIRNYVDSREAITRTYTDNRLAETRYYVDHKHVKNNVGLIPDLNHNNNNKSGFGISAEGTASVIVDGKTTTYPPFNVFNSRKGDWVVKSFPIMVERWIKVRCPEPVKIHKFTIKGRESKDGVIVGEITEWKFQGSLDDSRWDDLYTSHYEVINRDFKTFQIPPVSERYIYYRFIILKITNDNDNVGLSHLQIYSADPIM